MKIELSYFGVGRNRRYYATAAKAGRPRKGSVITKSKKPFAVGTSRSDAIQNYLDLIGFKPSDSK